MGKTRAWGLGFCICEIFGYPFSFEYPLHIWENSHTMSLSVPCSEDVSVGCWASNETYLCEALV